MNNKYPIVPVVMFHMIADHADRTPLHWLGTPIWLMEYCLSYLKREGYTTLRLHELYDYLNEGKNIPERSVMLTFDDGYLDNWVYAYPLLKKYGMTGVIWASADFIVRSSVLRPTLDDVWAGRIARSDLIEHGYLSDGELMAMEASGVFEIGAHGKTHTRFFSSDKIVDFQHPNSSEYYWLAWNRNPECRLAWLTTPVSSLIPLGTPIYENGLATCTRQYFSDKRLEEHLVMFVQRSGESQFFQNSKWKSLLYQQVHLWQAEHASQGRYETDDELHERLWLELTAPKTLLESVLGHSVDFFCWPGGGTSPLGLKMAEKAGYLATTVRSLPNQYGKYPSMISRVCMTHYQLPLLEKQMSQFYFRYIIEHPRKKFPYYQLWFVQRLLRGNSANYNVELRSSLSDWAVEKA